MRRAVHSYTPLIRYLLQLRTFSRSHLDISMLGTEPSHSEINPQQWKIRHINFVFGLVQSCLWEVNSSWFICKRGREPIPTQPWSDIIFTHIMQLVTKHNRQRKRRLNRQTLPAARRDYRSRVRMARPWVRGMDCCVGLLEGGYRLHWYLTL